jgi:hypothetical protein
MRVTILHQGIPIGVGDLAVDGTFAGGEVNPLPGYKAIQPTVRQAWRAMSNLGYLPPGPGAAGGVNTAGDAAGREAFERAAVVSRALELRDARGALIPTEWVELTDGGEGSDVSLMAEISIAAAAAPARPRPHPRGDADSSAPAT